MKISRTALEIQMAKRCQSYAGLRKFVSSGTVTKIIKGCEVTPRTVGKIASALNIDVEQLITKES